MLGVLANLVTVLIGCGVGMIFRKGISEKITNAAMTAIGLCCICMGVSGMLEGTNTLILIAAMVSGSIIGTALDLDGRFNRLGSLAASKFKTKDGESRVAEGFITASLVFCVGSMTIIGGLNAGLKGDNTMYYTKALMDLVSSAMLTSALGPGVALASVTVLVYQGLIVILASLLSPLLTADIIAEINCAGSLMIFALGLNLTGIGKFKVANMLPAMIAAPVICLVVKLF